MRVLQVVHQYPPEYVGGVELYTRQLVHHLQARGHDVSVFVPSRYVRDTHPLPNVHTVKGATSPSRRFLATLISPRAHTAFEHIVEQIRPDIVHIQHLMGLPVSLVQVLHKRNIPYIVTLSDYWWVCANAQLLTNYDNTICQGPAWYLNCARCVAARLGTPPAHMGAPAFVALLALRNHLLKRALLMASLLVAPTNFVQQWYALQGIPVERIIVLPHGVERPAEHIQPSPPGSRSVLRFLYLGGLAFQKGVHVIVEAFRSLEGPAELWIAGHMGPSEAYVRQLQALASPGVRFLGKLNRPAVWRALAEADVVLVPSLWYETFCLVVHEAFVMGRPVIASNLGALAERVRNGQDGLLVPPGDVKAWCSAMQHLVKDRQRLAQLAAHIRSQPTWEEHTDRIVALYHKAQVVRNATPLSKRQQGSR